MWTDEGLLEGKAGEKGRRTDGVIEGQTDEGMEGQTDEAMEGRRNKQGQTYGGFQEGRTDKEEKDGVTKVLWKD